MKAANERADVRIEKMDSAYLERLGKLHAAYLEHIKKMGEAMKKKTQPIE